jgi:hypothetical protein
MADCSRGARWQAGRLAVRAWPWRLKAWPKARFRGDSRGPWFSEAHDDNHQMPIARAFGNSCAKRRCFYPFSSAERAPSLGPAAIRSSAIGPVLPARKCSSSSQAAASLDFPGAARRRPLNLATRPLQSGALSGEAFSQEQLFSAGAFFGGHFLKQAPFQAEIATSSWEARGWP